MTDIILIEDVYKLGKIGQIVTVKPGYARNFLIPQKKALRANKDNIAAFEVRKVELIKRADETKAVAHNLAQTLSGTVFEIITQASEKGMLYGAVTAISAGKVLNENGFYVAKDAVQIIKPIKTVGIYHVQVVLHADVTCQVTLNVASSREQAAANLADDTKTTEVAA